MLTRKGIDVADRISSILPSQERIPIYIPNQNQTFDEKTEMFFSQKQNCFWVKNKSVFQSETKMFFLSKSDSSFE